MEFIYHKFLVPCIGKFEYMFYLIFLPECNEIVVELIKTYRGLSIGKRCNQEQKK